MITKDHWLKSALRKPSLNFSERPLNTDISLLVVHNISLPPKEFGGPYIDDLFTNQLDPNAHPFFQEIYQLQVASHLLIRRNGDVHQYVPFDKAAYHAGKSSFQGQERCNEFSIGIELEGADDIPYEDQQYIVLKSISLALLKKYPNITTDRITGHSDIAPGRKTDPGPAFDWNRFLSEIEK